MILVISTCLDKLSENEFVKPILKSVGQDTKFKHYSDIKISDLKDANKVIICGTALKDNDYLNNLDKFNWVKSFKKPILGICSGMQIIGLIFGAKLTKDSQIGMSHINITQKNKLLDNGFEAYELHNNSLNNLYNFEVLAEANGKVSVIKKINKEIYGIIFHPEVRNSSIIKKFINS